MKKLFFIGALCHLLSACETFEEIVSTMSYRQYVQTNYNGTHIDGLVTLIGAPTSLLSGPSHYIYVWGNEEIAEICTSEIVQPTNQGMQAKAQRICSETKYFCKLLVTTSKNDGVIASIKWQERTDRLRNLGECPDWLIEPIKAEIRHKLNLKKQHETALATP